MTDLESLKNFCAVNGLTPQQISDLFNIIKEIQTDTINQCYSKILGTLEAKSK